MNQDELKSAFDRQAPTYDQQWARLDAFRQSIHLLLGSVFSDLPSHARLLCIGAGTGAEIQYLAARFPHWTFTAVEPSAGMLGECRRRLTEAGHAGRCTFHEGYLDSLPECAPFDAATCLLVSQFILQRHERQRFFEGIARQLRPGAILASSDLALDTASPGHHGLLDAWLRTLAAADPSPERLQQMREAYARDVAVLPPTDVEGLLVSAGFRSPVQFFQAGLMHAWTSTRP